MSWVSLPVSPPTRLAERAGGYRFASPITLARNSFLNLASELWTFAVLIVAMPILVSHLGKDGFGLFSLAWVVLGYMAILDLGTSRAATKFISEHLAQHDFSSIEAVACTATAVNLILGVVGGVIVAGITPWVVKHAFTIPIQYQGSARIIFYSLGGMIPLILLQAAFRGILCSYQAFGAINLLNSIAVTCQWGVSCILAMKHVPVALIVMAAIPVRLIIVVAYAASVIRINRALLGLSVTGLDLLKRLLGFGGWVSVSQLMTPLLIYLDRILVASLLSIGTMTVYVIPYELVTRLRVIPGSVVTALFPGFSERNITTAAGVTELYNGAIRYLLIVLVPCFLFMGLLGSEVISVWIGREYARQGAIVLEIMAIGALLNSVAHVPYTALQALGRPDIPAKIHVLELPIYVALSLIFIPVWGISGAAIAVTIRLIIDSFALLWTAERYVNCRIHLRGLSKIISLNLALAVALWLLSRSAISATEHLIAGTFAIVVYLISIWFMALDERDRPMLLRVLRLSSEPAS